MVATPAYSFLPVVRKLGRWNARRRTNLQNSSGSKLAKLQDPSDKILVRVPRLIRLKRYCSPTQRYYCCLSSSALRGRTNRKRRFHGYHSLLCHTRSRPPKNRQFSFCSLSMFFYFISVSLSLYCLNCKFVIIVFLRFSGLGTSTFFRSS